MPNTPQTDWDMIHRWELFRRAQWLEDFRRGRMEFTCGPCTAFRELATVVNAEVVLNASCGLGLKTIRMAKDGLNVLGSDGSVEAIEWAKKFAKEEAVDVTFFPSLWADLPTNMPHAFDAIFTDVLSLEPDWETLKASLAGFFYALNPGGFLMFMGAPEGADSGKNARQLERAWDGEPPESVDWLHREGKKTCVKVRQRSRGDDFIDERLLFISDDDGHPEIESTTVRIPFYWDWPHWDEVVRGAGFCHLETHSFEIVGEHGRYLRANVAWKAKNEHPAADDGRNEPYAD